MSALDRWLLFALSSLTTAGLVGDHRLLLGSAAVAAVATTLDVRARWARRRSNP